MIKLGTGDGKVLFILEPGNITRLKFGEPITVNLKELGLEGEIILAFCPDIEWLALQLGKHIPCSAETVVELLNEGATRPSVDRAKVN
jgi:hypothetical protein